MRTGVNVAIAFVLLVPGVVSPAAAEGRPPQSMSLFGTPPAGSAPGGQIPGMRPETVGAVAYVSLSAQANSGLRGAAGSQRIEIALPGGGSVTCTMRSETRPGGMLLLTGVSSDGGPSGRCNLVVDRGQITGEIDVASGRYQIVPMGAGSAHAVVEVRTEEFPNEVEPQIPPDEPRQERPVAPNAAPQNVQGCDVRPRPGQQPKAFGPVRVMIVYTRAAKADTANIRAEIELIMNQTREAFSLQNTGGNFSVAVELAHVQEVAYQETNLSEDLRHLSDPQDPIFRAIHAMRDRFRADVVHMLIKKQSNEGCGVGWLNLPMRADLAFSLSDRQCALGQFSATHEIAHTLGLAHDRFVVPEEKQRPGDFNFGFVSVDKGFRTIMSYPDECTQAKKRCPRVLYFSSPNIQLNGVNIGRPLWDPDAAYNLEQLCRNAPLATRFR